MTKSDIDFDGWFDVVVMRVEEKSGVAFNDADSVREDYDDGRNAFDVADEIADEYSA